MAQKKRNNAKKPVSKNKKPLAGKVARKKRSSALRKNRSPKGKPAPKVKRAVKKRASSASSAKEIQSPEQSTLSGRTFRRTPGKRVRGGGSGDAGQSGDLQGLSQRAIVDSESVAELIQEGQFHEAEAVAAVEDARDPDQGELRTREVPEDDVPEEYLDKD